jgi:hypothetical protein
MGLLDDAIREHLELKRRHGADPSEVERQEQEALGPARRGAAPPLGDFEEEAGAVAAGTLDDDDEPLGAPYDDDDDFEDDDDTPEPSVPAGEPEAPVAPPAPRDAADDPAVLDADDVPDVHPEPPPEPHDLPAGEQAAANEDVLEETPDFLQETPEHDRLWFEQKPPRDFEF